MFLNFNGEVRDEGAALLRADNRGFRYGDGLFETMLARGGRVREVRLGEYHVERLVRGMRLLRLELPQPFGLEILEGQVAELCARNGWEGDCRVRLTVFRSGRGAYNGLERLADYIIQTSALTAGGAAGGAGREKKSGSGPPGEGGSVRGGWRKEGLKLGIFPDGRKVCDGFSEIKSNNYLLSSLAGMYAAEQGLDDCVVLNSRERVAETTMANIWWAREGRIATPPLSEGGVAGVMRRFLLEALPAAGYEVRQEPIGPAELMEADEIFISNAIRGIQWVREVGGHSFGCRLAAMIHDEIISKI